jgi:hypothetical protein
MVPWESKLILRIVIGVLAATALASVPLGLALAHEAHHAKCSETAMNATKADIQAMPDGEAKTKAMHEMDMAEAMMSKKDMEGCDSHMHNAMEAMEE